MHPVVPADATATALANVTSLPPSATITSDVVATADPAIKNPVSDCKKLRIVLAKRFTKVIQKCSLAMQEVYSDKEDFKKHFQVNYHSYI